MNVDILKIDRYFLTLNDRQIDTWIVCVHYIICDMIFVRIDIYIYWYNCRQIFVDKQVNLKVYRNGGCLRLRKLYRDNFVYSIPFVKMFSKFWTWRKLEKNVKCTTDKRHLTITGFKQKKTEWKTCAQIVTYK